MQMDESASDKLKYSRLCYHAPLHGWHWEWTTLRAMLVKARDARQSNVGWQTTHAMERKQGLERPSQSKECEF
jgi:hypothetical protein